MEEILIGSTDRTILVYIPDPASTDGSGKTGLVAANITVSYSRVETDNDVTVTDVTSSVNNLSALTDAHNDWGWLEVSATVAPGQYRLDIADAVFATGAWYAVVQVTITTSLASATPKAFKLVNFDMFGQSATDLKDFADDGYDPSTNKVQGVVLTDTVTTYTGNTPQTGDAFARLGAPAGASVSADILVIDNFVDDLESRLGTPSNLGSGATIAANLVDIEGQTDDIGAAGAGLTAVPWNPAWDAEVQSEVVDGLAAYPINIAPSGYVQADMYAIRSDLNAALGAEKYFDGTGYGDILHRTTIATLTSQIVFTLNTGSADNDAYNDCIIVIEDASTAAQKAVGFVSDYVGATREVTLKTNPGIFTMAVTDIVTILAVKLDSAAARSALGLASANLDNQLDALPTNSELATAITTGLTTGLTEGYRATGAIGSVRDLLYEILAGILDHSITGTTKTTRKIDGTTAKTYTLDSSTTPTSITETT